MATSCLAAHRPPEGRAAGSSDDSAWTAQDGPGQATPVALGCDRTSAGGDGTLIAHDHNR